jgi:hypothetical protein
MYNSYISFLFGILWGGLVYGLFSWIGNLIVFIIGILLVAVYHMNKLHMEKLKEQINKLEKTK